MKRLWALFAVLALVFALIVPDSSAQDSSAQNGHHQQPIGEVDEKVDDTAGQSPAGQSAAALAAVQETQGPENHYVLLDSNDPGGPSSSAPDPSFCQVITPEDGTSDLDDDEIVYPLPIDFAFYSTIYASGDAVTVGVNGAIRFDQASSVEIWPGNRMLPNVIASPEAVGPAVYGFWDDLYLQNAVGIGGGRNIQACSNLGAEDPWFGFRWQGMTCYSGCDRATETIDFWIILYADGAIELNYQDVQFGSGSPHNDGALATVGIDAGNRSTFLQYSHNRESLTAPLAIRMWRPTCADTPATGVGTRGDDIAAINTSYYYAHAGDDDIDFTGVAACGAGGDDTMTVAGSVVGPVVLSGGPGNDRLFGSTGPDILLGDEGDDNAWGGDGADIIHGGRGIDRLRGEGGPDVIQGEDGRDVILGGAGEDRIWGNQGRDSLYGNDGNDKIRGDGDTDLVRGGPGDDEIWGGDARDLLLGEAGQDTIYGDAGRDSVWGGPDDDILDGGADTDSVKGDGGDDTLTPGPSGNDNLIGGDGIDILDGSSTTGSVRIVGDAGDDIITGSNQADKIWGMAGNDTINAGGHNDTVNGGTGSDIINGGDRNDILNGADGNNDLVNGGPGNDRVVGGNGTGDFCDGGAGVDTANGTCETITSIP